MIINDIIFGELEYDNYDWIKQEKETYNFFGKDYEINLTIIGGNDEPDEVIKSIQRDAYVEYKNHLEEINLLVEDAIYDYYQQECDEYRGMFEDEADLLAPIITDKKELCNLVKLQYIFIGNDDNNRVLIFVFDAVWDMEEGISVKISNEKLEIIGGFSEMYMCF